MTKGFIFQSFIAVWLQPTDKSIHELGFSQKITCISSAKSVRMIACKNSVQVNFLSQKSTFGVFITPYHINTKSAIKERF
jgi:hypothetical protein